MGRWTVGPFKTECVLCKNVRAKANSSVLAYTARYRRLACIGTQWFAPHFYNKPILDPASFEGYFPGRLWKAIWEKWHFSRKIGLLMCRNE